MSCHGNGNDHCCYLGDKGVCPHLEENTVPGRRWACGLLRRYGSWEAAEASEEYQTDVQPFMNEFDGGRWSCSTWPEKYGNSCATCGWKPGDA